MIEIKEHQIKELVKAAYNMSSPVGMGFLHATPADMTDEEAEALIDMDSERRVVGMDYVKGRQCKFSILKLDGKFAVQGAWYDHSDREYAILLNSVGVPLPQHLQENLPQYLQGDLTHAD